MLPSDADVHLTAGPDTPILVTGAAGFIGRRLVENLVARGFRRIRCLRRPGAPRFDGIPSTGDAAIEWIEGNLLSPADCRTIVEGAEVIFHLAAGRGEKSVPDAFLNSVVTTRNLLDAALAAGTLKRLVAVSSFAVYSNRARRGNVLDETAPLENEPVRRGDAYTYAKVKQEELIRRYGRERGLPYVIVRPGAVYGPGNEALSPRIGIPFGSLFLHLGGANRIPLTYVDNCAEAIALAGLRPGIDGEALNVVDDGLPTSRRFFREYRRKVKRLRSCYVPHAVSYALCWAWERYVEWSAGQLPPAFNRHRWHATWRRTEYSNGKLKRLLGWQPVVSPAEAQALFFASCRAKEARHA